MDPQDRNHIESGGPVSFIHETGDGPVHLLVKASRAGWDSLHWNSKVAGSWTFKTLAEANENVLQCFQRVYLGHRCSNSCRPVETIDTHKSDDLWGIVRDG